MPLLFLYIAGNCQQLNSKIDSLNSLIQAHNGIVNYEPLISLSRIYASSNKNEEALKTAEQARMVALKYGDSTHIVNSSRIIGILFNRMDRPNEAEKILLEAMPCAKRNNLRDDYKSILNNLAVAYTIQAKYDKALNMHFEALKLREEDGDSREISISLNNIGLVYFKLKNYETALEFYNRALKLEQFDYLLVNIGLCYNQLEDFKKAQEYFNKALMECDATCSDRIRVDAEFGLGVADYGMGNILTAKQHFASSYRAAVNIKNRRFQAENLMYFSHIYIKQQKLDSALITLRQCEELAFDEGYNELLIEAFKEFSMLFSKKKDFESSSYYQNKYIVLKDSIYNQDLIKNIASAQTNFAQRENLATIADKEEIIQRQRSLNIAIAIIAILAAALIFVLYRSIQVKKKVNAALSEAKAIIEDQNKQLLNSNQSLDKELKQKNVELQKANESLKRVNEELDNFIYKTSHDIRGPLASLKGMCNVALMDVKDPVALGYLSKLDITAEKLNTILTRLLIVNQINNSTVGSEKIDFNTLINDVLVLEKKKGLPPNLSIRKKIDSEIEFYSDKEFIKIILENLIDNAIKFHNDSSRVEPFVNINITMEDDALKIRVIDNGIGISEIDPEKLFHMFSRASERSETGGIGLYITKTAVQKLNGTIHLSTTPEGFTQFLVTLPASVEKVVMA